MGISTCSGGKHWRSVVGVKHQSPPLHMTVACTPPLYLNVWGGMWGFIYL